MLDQDNTEQNNSDKQNNQEMQNNNNSEQASDPPIAESSKETKITPDTVMNMENEKNEFEKEHNIYHIHYNISGDAQINAGEIYENMSQEKNTSNKTIKNMDDVQKIFGMEQTVDEFQMLIVLCILTIVPDNHFIALVNELKRCWMQKTEENTKSVSPYISVQEILKLGAEKVVANFYDESGKSEVSCFHLKNPEIAAGVKRMIWVDYPVIRNFVVQWMFQIVQMKQFRNLILSQVGEAFQDLASMDYNFTKIEIIGALVKRGKNDDYYFLNKIMEKLLETDTYKENAINLMKHWCTSGNEQQRTMVYSLYQENRDKKAAYFIQNSMKNIIQKELCNGKLFYDETDRLEDAVFSKTQNINFRVLQENDVAATLYAKALMEVFEDCTTVKKRIFGFYFCHIFLLDFFYEGYPRYQMMFINLLQKKENRKILLSLYHYVWKKKVFRDIMSEVLNYYLNQLWKENLDWTYAKGFFRSISFTGAKSDFENTDKMLRKIEMTGNTVAEQLRKDLQRLLKQRLSENRR